MVLFVKNNTWFSFFFILLFFYRVDICNVSIHPEHTGVVKRLVRFICIGDVIVVIIYHKADNNVKRLKKKL